MRFLRNSLVAAVACLCTVSASAQTTEADYQEALKLGYRPYPYWFAQIQGGVGTTFTNKAFTDLISPTASVGFGRFFGSFAHGAPSQKRAKNGGKQQHCKESFHLHYLSNLSSEPSMVPLLSQRYAKTRKSSISKSK